MRDQRDFEQFFRSHYERTYYLAFSILHDKEVSRDIVADAFADLFNAEAAGEMTVQDLRNYLYMIVRHKCADHYRRLSVHDKYASYVMQSAERTTCDDWLEHEEKVEMVDKAMQQLPPRTRHILDQHYVLHKKYSEMASELNISESAVKKHVIRALNFFRTKFVKE